jgi:DNA-binding NtrC family response regulator
MDANDHNTGEALTTVLVVEDDASIRDFAVMMLEGEGYRVLAADCAHSALAILKEHAAHTAVLFTDVRMPGALDGLKLADIVHLSWPAMKILVTSGDAGTTKAALPPRARFLPKPWHADDVIGLVRSLAEPALPQGTAPVGAR